MLDKTEQSNLTSLYRTTHEENKKALVDAEILNLLEKTNNDYEEYVRLTSYTTDTAKDYQREIYRDVNYPLSIVLAKGGGRKLQN